MSDDSFLIVSATELEIKPLLDNNSQKITENKYSTHIANHNVEILITGVGISAMTYALTKELALNNHKFIILAGIAGSFSDKFPLGSMVNIMHEEFGDLGFRNADIYTPITSTNLIDSNTFPYENSLLSNYTLINNKVVNSLQIVKGSTVQTMESNMKFPIKTEADVESMEGAAFFYTCMMEKQAFIQIRSISNLVGETDKSKWDIPLAVGNLNKTIVAILEEIK